MTVGRYGRFEGVISRQARSLPIPVHQENSLTMVLPCYLAWNMLALESAKLIQSETRCPNTIYEYPFSTLTFWRLARLIMAPTNSMSKLTFLGLAERILREENKPLSPSEIWKTAVAKEYDKKVGGSGKTPEATLYAAIFNDTRDRPDTIFVKIGERPARYFLKELYHGKETEIENISVSDDTAPFIFDYKEADLHQFVAYYSRTYFKAYTKTIRHAAGPKKEFGEWVHPDMIGVYYSVEDWKTEVLDLSAAIGTPAIKLYSFEIKKSLSFANLREAFFQAVSNSSWANEGYLAAAEISSDEDFRAELRRLSAAFGIGILSISLDDPDASEILAPARENAIDWDTLNKLTINKDVTDLLKRIKNDLQTKEVIREKYEKILTSADLVASIKKAKKP